MTKGHRAGVKGQLEAFHCLQSRKTPAACAHTCARTVYSFRMLLPTLPRPRFCSPSPSISLSIHQKHTHPVHHPENLQQDTVSGAPLPPPPQPPGTTMQPLSFQVGREGGTIERWGEEETIWAEVGDFQSVGRKKEASWDEESVCTHVFVVIYARE